MKFYDCQPERLATGRMSMLQNEEWPVRKFKSMYRIVSFLILCFIVELMGLGTTSIVTTMLRNSGLACKLTVSVHVQNIPISTIVTSRYLINL